MERYQDYSWSLIEDAKGKHKYRISLVSDGVAEGFVEMTDEEYQVIRRVFDRKNWEPYSPSLYIHKED